MANKVTEEKTANTEQQVGEFVSRSEQFINNNKKNITFGLLAVAAILAIVLGYHYGYSIPKNKKAAKAISQGEFYFQKDSFNLALNGDGGDYEGFDYIIKHYGNTKVGNTAKLYAGICNYKLGNINEALKLAKSFKTDDAEFGPAALALVGDCYVESGDVKQGISYFEKAASKANSVYLSPIFLKKAGLAYESLQQYDNAIKTYTEIKEKYAASMEAMDIDKYIVRAQSKK